ncbi:pyridoxamine 5'-phosphate oxidase family protein [Halorientalis regularis]|jgi:nitroimidazol reductase NimA-like FMN-containing flavoprotein (pyridoxamine 5'-phosphate oxidase superfamily)|uniref:Nitroimidazol reductase NimA, pyridoxamine 5'-phosphate oxidase superfamily n=1 Tax=Halorientalis regularis TaxID=660518 RepID=A0A1G7PC85_9EURY|nr:pyridoxamine 5'-phosphate oxidase family protein [Halorientalis regularis]SDF83080.1 hypothetical protein SAMN05216218_11039 [Halorientalis regularis]
MQGLRWVQLSSKERDAFLGDGGTGVLSFSTPPEEPPWLLPISYGYDANTGLLYFSLSFPAGSTKSAVVDGPVAFATHEETPDGWRSVVAVGTLEEVADMPYESSAVQGLWTVEIPAVDIFDRPREEVTFRDFVLDPETITGRKEVQTEG